MKKNFMLIVALAAALFFAAPMTSEASDGEVKGNWKADSTGWWYEFEDGTYYTDGFYEIDGVTYYFDKVGYMATGWKKVDYQWYYFQESGAMVTGWNVINGSWYYLEPEFGWMFEEGTCEIDEKLYLFDKDGAWMGTPGWNELFHNGYNDDSTWYYLDANGNVCTGWQAIGGKWYYFSEGDDWDNKGYMYENNKYTIMENDEPVEYLFGADGAWIESTGWNYAGGWYYITANKEYATGWQAINGEWYYFEPNEEAYNYGMMYSFGERYIEEEDKTYFFENSGAMVDGWYNYANAFSTYGDWVYCYADGTPAEKWAAINGKWYYFNEGLMLSDQWIEDENDDEVRYFLGLDGAMVTGWYHDEFTTPHSHESYGWIYTDPASGAAYTGWVLSGAKWYFITDGHMERSCAAHTVEMPDYPQQEDFWGEDGIFSEEEQEAYWDACHEWDVAREENYEAYKNSLYVFGDDGAMVTGGWYQYKSTWGSTWYYANADGTAATGWKEISGKWYYFDYDYGYMCTNCYIDGCWLGADGAWVK